MTTPDPMPTTVPDEAWEEAIARAARFGFIVRIDAGDDGRISARFERLDDPRIQVFTAAEPSRLLGQIHLCLDIANAAIRGAMRHAQDKR